MKQGLDDGTRKIGIFRFCRNFISINEGGGPINLTVMFPWYWTGFFFYVYAFGWRWSWPKHLRKRMGV